MIGRRQWLKGSVVPGLAAWAVGGAGDVHEGGTRPDRSCPQRKHNSPHRPQAGNDVNQRHGTNGARPAGSASTGPTRRSTSCSNRFGAAIIFPA